MPDARDLVVWRLLDGKRGHENQTLGLVQALGERRPLRVHDLSVPPRWTAWLDLLLGRCPAGRDLPSPDLLLGAGHATHLAILACRRARGGRAVILMRPSLPVSWFDLCIIPEHDGVPAGPHVLLSRGALNAVRPSPEQCADRGLVLVGGPSAHHAWDEARLLAQVEEVMRRDPRDWVIATSRRTPVTTQNALRARFPAARVVAPAQAGTDWLAGELARAPVAWVTEDSVSMLYEALTAGAGCGVLDVPPRRPSRIRAGLDRLLAEGLVVTFRDWRDGGGPPRATVPFNESARCADWLVERWFDD